MGAFLMSTQSNNMNTEPAEVSQATQLSVCHLPCLKDMVFLVLCDVCAEKNQKSNLSPKNELKTFRLLTDH
jgi:hypothetical protein